MDGYEGDGFSCQPIDLCSQPERGGCSQNVSGIGLSKHGEATSISQSRTVADLLGTGVVPLSQSVRWDGTAGT